MCEMFLGQLEIEKWNLRVSWNLEILNLEATEAWGEQKANPELRRKGSKRHSSKLCHECLGASVCFVYDKSPHTGCSVEQRSGSFATGQRSYTIHSRAFIIFNFAY